MNEVNGKRHWEEIIGDMTDAGDLPAEEAASICDSDRCLAVFGAPEWAELSNEGKKWIAALIQESVARLHKREGKSRGPCLLDDLHNSLHRGEECPECGHDVAAEKGPKL